jgi:hypothetical protein
VEEAAQNSQRYEDYGCAECEFETNAHFAPSGDLGPPVSDRNAFCAASRTVVEAVRV